MDEPGFRELELHREANDAYFGAPEIAPYLVHVKHGFPFAVMHVDLAGVPDDVAFCKTGPEAHRVVDALNAMRTTPRSNLYFAANIDDPEAGVPDE